MKAPKKVFWRWHEKVYGRDPHRHYFESAARTVDELEQELVDRAILNRRSPGYCGIEAERVKKPSLAALCRAIDKAMDEEAEAHQRRIELRDQKIVFYGLDKFPKKRRKKTR